MAAVSHDAATVRVLVVEDDENNRLVISRLLRLSGVSDDRIFSAGSDASVQANQSSPAGGNEVASTSAGMRPW